MKQVIDGIIEQGKSSIVINEDDYIGEDGLWYCGKCKTRKQGEYKFPWGVARPLHLCKCGEEQRDKEEAEWKRKQFDMKVQELRKTGFSEKDMQQWTFANDDMTNERLTTAMQNYVKNFATLRKVGKGLLLYGTVGTGKTFAACEVANALIDMGYPVMVTNFSRLINTLQGTFEKQEYIDSLNNFELLIIDDLGIERDTPFAKEQVYTIIDSRYRAGLPMIITTNLSMEKIKKPDDIENQRIYDRILERCFPIEVTGGSRRRKAVREGYDEMKELLGL